ncbi:autotransporter outer membrane beta-barrel domain-containing protein [Bartonella taylorii]|uniref:autotransporter outer membrane beta-barrel domain-containing protein n=1 Tax=Bartonella taylorii TaxID=33046 RepID=UPI001ABB8509|nr:autotransporter outer membrane beta-barrel domain-containing protein [Bartonella taylorii]
MYKTSFLSCTVAAAIVLFNIQFSAHAETLEVSDGKTIPVSDKTYETIHAKDGGKIIGKNLTINHPVHYDVYAVTAEGVNSVIELQDSKIIPKLDSEISRGLEAKDGATIKMIGGSIAAASVGASFNNTNSSENMLKDVVISDLDKDGLQLLSGIVTKGSTLTLKNVTVMHASNALKADDHSTITVSGGSFDGELDGIYVSNGSTVTIENRTEITSSSGYGLYAEGSKSKITMTGGTVSGSAGTLFAENGGHINVTGVTITSTDGTGDGAHAGGFGSIIELHNTTIKDVSTGLFTQPNGTIKMTGGSITASIIGASFFNNSKSAENKLENVKISSGKDDDQQLFGVVATHDSNLTLKNTTVTQANIGIASAFNSQINVSGGEFNVKTSGVSTESGSTIIIKDNAQINASDGSGLHASGPQSQITMTDGTVFGKKAALYTENGGHIDVTNVSATAQIGGLQIMSLSYTDPDNPQKRKSSEINLVNTKLHVENGAGILIGAFTDNDIENNADLAIGTVNLKNSEIHANVLLGNGIYWKDSEFWDQVGSKAISNGTFTLNADHSTLEGRANIAKDRNVHFDLKNDTTWTLKISKNEKDDDGNLLDIAQRSRSDISTLNLDNSSIVFDKPTEEHYQILHIGSGKPDTKAVYNATGDAKIYFNAKWSDGAAINDQKTDRLLIHGDVSGNTSVYVTGRLENDNVKANTSAAANIRGLSLIQVSGKAEESSFKLVNGYTTRGGLPDMYTLRAYGPDSSQGKANITQNLFDEKNQNFWDFRLQPELLGNGSGSGSGPSVIAPVPQTASYLVMPNALFYSGLTDMAKQNALLANIRASVLGKEEEKQTGFFLYTYGSTGTLSSERGPLKYSYSADIRYAALQAGVTLAAIEGQSTTTHFGLVGTYGRLSFTPKEMDDVSKSTLDKWSLTAYGSVQHDSGFYMDTLLSYGILKGDIGNAIRGNTAKLKNAKMLSISTTVGKEFATRMEGLTFEPQAQIAYQHLMFNTIEDADNFTVDMHNPSQWLIRVGGRLTKTISTENSRPMSFYGKVNLIKTFGDDGTIQIGRNFDLDPMGTAIEGGIGINAQLSHNFSLHGDVSYQQKLQKNGISGASFSGGIRYQF